MDCKIRDGQIVAGERSDAHTYDDLAQTISLQIHTHKNWTDEIKLPADKDHTNIGEIRHHCLLI